MSPYRIALVAALVVAVTGCTGDPAPEQPEVAAAPSSSPSPSPSPSASSSDTVLHGAATGRTYRVRLAGDQTRITMTGGPGETLREDVAVAGRYVAPQVVPGGPLEGLSPNGRWLVLESHAPAPAERSVFLILTGRLGLERDTLDLPGRFTFDAWAPDGSVLYLIEHKPPAASGHYVVRAYDMQKQALRPDPVADKRNVGEQMAGRPVARAATPDNAVVATLYVRQGDGDEHGPFVHLLYAADGQALCVDLPPGTPVGTSSKLEYLSGSFLVLPGAPGRTDFRIDPVSGELTPAPEQG